MLIALASFYRISHDIYITEEENNTAAAAEMYIYLPDQQQQAVESKLLRNYRSAEEREREGTNVMD